MVEKTAGCKHMTCSICRHQFCWHCEAVWSSSHVCLKVSSAQMAGMSKELQSRVAGPAWAAGCLVVCCALGLTRLLRSQYFDLCVEFSGLAAIMLAGGGLGLRSFAEIVARRIVCS